MNNLEIEYPRDWFEAKRLVKNLENECKRIIGLYPVGKQRSKAILKVIKISYAILDSLDRAILVCENSTSQRKLLSAKAVLYQWLQGRTSTEKINARK